MYRGTGVKRSRADNLPLVSGVEIIEVDVAPVFRAVRAACPDTPQEGAVPIVRPDDDITVDGRFPLVARPDGDWCLLVRFEVID